MNDDFVEAVQANTYPKRKVHTHNDIGTVIISTKGENYLSSMTSEEKSGWIGGVTDKVPIKRVPALEAKMKINVVRNVDIIPKYKSLYISPHKQNSFTFTIIEGSSFYSVRLNNTELADFV